MSLVTNPNQFSSLNIWICHLHSSSHAVGAVHQEGDGAVIDGCPFSTGLPSEDAAQGREPLATILGFDLHSQRCFVDQKQVTIVEICFL